MTDLPPDAWMVLYDPRLDRRLTFVGTERHHTRVWSGGAW